MAAKNVGVSDLNFKIQQSYELFDRVCDANEAVYYPREFLNSLDLRTMSPQHLQMKSGPPVILLRNLNPAMFEWNPGKFRVENALLQES